ncbi:unnamed protein product, partial [Rotaria magnacalcarata]
CYGQVDTTETKVNVIDEFERYLKPSDSLLNDDEDLFAFWERQKDSYSILHSITCEILITHATNTAVEHLFSSSGNAVTETRSSTTTALNIINSGIAINTGEKRPYGRLSEEDGDFIYAGDSNDYEKQKSTTIFVHDALERNPDTVGVMFIMTIDPSKISTSITSFAMIGKHSALPQEQEILFAMHSVFRIVEITQTPSNSRLWEIQLTITDESDPQLSTLTNRIKDEIDGRGWHRLGYLLLEVGHFDQAEELYNELLENASDDSDRARIYHQLGWVKRGQGEYKDAVKFYEKSLEIERKILPEDDASLAPTYSNMGLVFNDMGDYSKALEYYEKSHQIREKTLPPTHSNLATSYNKIGGLKTLPEKHPYLGICYSNIGDVHRLMGDYEKTLAFHPKALNIQENAKCNPLECPTTYMNLGETYCEMKDYTTALTYYQKRLNIRDEKLAKTHPDLAVIYHNMSKFYFKTQ